MANSISVVIARSMISFFRARPLYCSRACKKIANLENVVQIRKAAAAAVKTRNCNWRALFRDVKIVPNLQLKYDETYTIKGFLSYIRFGVLRFFCGQCTELFNHRKNSSNNAVSTINV